MARKPVTDLSAWPSLTLEGNLIAPAMVAAVANPRDDEDTRQSYRIRRGLSIRDEISTAFRVGQSHFDAFRKQQHPSADATRRFIREFLTETLGFDDLAPHEGSVSFLAGGRVPVVVTPPSEERLDRKSITLSTDRSRSAAFALQDYLNDRDDALWGIATNGNVLRLLRDNASLTRPAYIEADLAQIFINEDAASFAVLWLLCHRSRFGLVGSPATDCALERWRDTGSKEGEAARDRLAGQVQVALKVLGSGFLEANPELARRLQSGDIPLTGWFNELLRLVYRLIFLMVAEDRNLLHPPKSPAAARKLYAEGYSLSALRAACTRSATWDRHHDRFEGVKIIFRALAAGESALALPALGGLFADDQLPHLEIARLRNSAFMEAIYRLSWLSEKSSMVPVNWRSMETEELGSVYEALLELQPQLGPDGISLLFASDAGEQKGNQRKTTGSYYTPDSLVQALLDSALDPVLDQTETTSDDPAEALLHLAVIDPACGSGHFLLGAARRIATRLARLRTEGMPSDEDFRHALRDVARCCIHGVDRNPMAVELTKVALWIETVDPGLPLGFFDAQVRCGDALIGIFDLKVLADGIPDSAYNALSGDDKDTAKYYAQANKGAKGGQGELNLGGSGWQMPDTKPLAVDFSGFRDLPEETVTQIGAKAKRFEELRQKAEFTRVRSAADLYVAAFLLPKTGGAPTNPAQRVIPTTEELWQVLNQEELRESMVEATQAARRARAFHWPLEFPNVMQRGGFDVVLGNPPWDTMSPDYKEFFAVYDPGIRHLSPTEQEKASARFLADPVIARRWSEHCNALYTAVHFIKSSGRYRLFAKGNLGKGDFNVYRMFIETALAATKEGQVAAQFVPEGLYNGANASAIRRELFSAFRLEGLAGFENTKGIWFPDVDTRMKFCSYVAWKGGRTADFRAAFRVNTREKLEAFKSGNALRIPVAIVEEFSPDAVAVMEFAAQSEIDICSRMYALYPKFGERVSNAPHRHYMREVDMGTDRDLFSEGEDGLPVFEGRMIDAYDYRAKGYVSGRGRSAVWEDYSFDSPEKRIQPQWRILNKRIPEKLEGRTERYRIGFGDVASPTNQRALVAALLPPSSVSGHSVPTIEFTDVDPRHLLLWIGVANSLAMDFLVRMKVSLHMTYTIMDSLPFPRNFDEVPSAHEIAKRVYSLCAVGPEMESFRSQASDIGILIHPNDVEEDPIVRSILASEINVLVARDVFKLSKDEMLYILDPDNILGKDCGVETFKALRNAEVREFGEFRTQSLILEAWDRLATPRVSPEESVIVQVPRLSDLKDGSWTWPPKLDRLSRLRYAAQYALWVSDPAHDGSRLRFLIACLAEPALLSSSLTDDERIQWERLVGSEARPLDRGVARLHPETNASWKSAFEQLITSGQLREDDDGAWIRGSHFDASGLSADSPDAQRTAFALNAIRRMDVEQIRPLIVLEDNVIWEMLAYGT